MAVSERERTSLALPQTGKVRRRSTASAGHDSREELRQDMTRAKTQSFYSRRNSLFGVRRKWRCLTGSILLLVSLATIVSLTGVNPNLRRSLSSLVSNSEAPGSSSEDLDVFDEDRICRNCSCSRATNTASLLSDSFTPVPSVEALRSAIRRARSFNVAGLAHFISRHVILRTAMEGVELESQAVSDILRTYYTCPDDQIAVNLGPLHLDRPTLYVYTRTSRGKGKVGGSWETRERYFDRHRRNMLAHLQAVRENGYFDGTAATDRQLLWVIVEDSATLDENLVIWLRSTTIRT